MDAACEFFSSEGVLSPKSITHVARLLQSMYSKIITYVARLLQSMYSKIITEYVARVLQSM